MDNNVSNPITKPPDTTSLPASTPIPVETPQSTPSSPPQTVTQPQPIVATAATPQQPLSPPTQPETLLPTKTKITYFIIGFIFQLIALLPVTLWLVIKVKENKKPRILNYLAGTVSAIVLWSILSTVINPILQKSLINRFPVMGYIPQELNQDYPNAEFGINVNYSKTISDNQKTTTTSTLRVDIQTDQDLSAIDRENLGRKVCNLLEEHGDEYTNIEIGQINVKKFLIFNFDQSYVEGRTCQEWSGE